MEFMLAENWEQQLPRSIGFNYEELKAALELTVAKYDGLVVTEEDISEARGDLADLRKLKAAVDSERIRVKKAYLVPYEKFADRCKALTSLIDGPIGAIDGQIKTFEKVDKDLKKGRLEKVFDVLVSDPQVKDAATYLTFEGIFNPRWLNNSFKEADAGLEMEAKIAACQRSVDAIRALGSSFQTELLEEFARTHDLARVLEHAKRLAERAKTEEALKAAAPGRKAAAGCPGGKGPKAGEDRAAPVEKAVVGEAQVYTLKFWAKATAEQLNGLKQYLLDNSIQYGKVE